MRAIIILAVSLMAVACGGVREIKKPQELSFGSSVEEIEKLVKPLCDQYSVREIVPPTAPLVKEIQTQIDCSGFTYAGKGRSIELVFQDDRLDIVWILFPEAERPKILRSFRASYGAPSMEIDFGAVFLQANAAVRNSPPEVLFASERQVKAMLKSLRDE